FAAASSREAAAGRPPAVPGVVAALAAVRRSSRTGRPSQILGRSLGAACDATAPCRQCVKNAKLRVVAAKPISRDIALFLSPSRTQRPAPGPNERGDYRQVFFIS